MGRRRVANVRLPKGVERVCARGRTYYYWNPGRGTDREGDRVSLPRTDLYLYSPRGDPYTETSVRARWNRWLRRTIEGRELCRRWQEWVTGQVRKYEWEIAADDANNPTIHGLRGAGILIRFALGYEVDQIANDVGMSRQMVEHYMRFKDQMQVAAGGSARLKIVSDRREG